MLQKRTRLAKRTLASLSLREAITWSFISKAAAELFGGGAASLALANPIAADLSDMRPSLVPGLVAAAERNARRALNDVALFEVGRFDAEVAKGRVAQDHIGAACGRDNLLRVHLDRQPLDFPGIGLCGAASSERRMSS